MSIQNVQSVGQIPPCAGLLGFSIVVVRWVTLCVEQRAVAITTCPMASFWANFRPVVGSGRVVRTLGKTGKSLETAIRNVFKTFVVLDAWN